MKRFILKRVMQYTEKLEIDAENWDAAKEIISSETEFGYQADDILVDSSIEFIGEVECQ